MVIIRKLCSLIVIAACMAREGGAQEPQTQAPPDGSVQSDPFDGIEAELQKQEAAAPAWYRKFFADNFTFKKELYLQLTSGYDVETDPPIYSRQSIGFEILKKFSGRTSTLAALNIQSRFVRRDNYIETLNDLEGMNREGFYLEYHNAYLDLYNVFNPLLSQSGRNKNLGRFNLRTGRFYLPFGINLQTDTHGTLLQLSNEQNFGFDRDWYTGLYGSASRDINYDVYYLLGSGYYPRFSGQSGMLGARISLGSRFRNEYGLEAGLSVLKGERISDPSMEQAAMEEPPSSGKVYIRTTRIGMDGRYTHPLWGGTAAFTTELSGGEDKPYAVFTQLHQLEFTSRSRRWGWATQYRRFWRDIPAPDKAESSIIGEFTYYGKNDVSSAQLQWVKVNIERRYGHENDGGTWFLNIQCYYYW